MSNAVAILSEPKDGNPSLQEFVNEHGRLPHIGDEKDPWTYRGWLLPYLQLCEAHPDVAPRYDYVARTLEAGKLLDEPIPQIGFVSEHSAAAKDGMKMLEQMVRIAEQGGRYSRGIETVCEWLGFAVAVTDQQPDIERRDQEQMYRTFDCGKWLAAPTDYIGEYMAAAGVGKAAAFFPTPMGVCNMMAMMTYSDGDSRAKTAMDCAVGTGRTLLAASNYCLRLFGQDINALCVLACKINFAFFAPWHLIPEAYFTGFETPETAPRLSEGQKTQPRGRNEREWTIETEVTTPKFTTKVEQLSLFDLLTVQDEDGDPITVR